MVEVWDLWYPQAGATGISFCRSRVDAAAAATGVLVHAAPRVLSVTVRDGDGRVVAEGTDLERREEGPMSYLVRDGDTITLRDGWPTDDDVGRLVLLPGGEAGVLKSWWHADDRSEWRWQVEFSNHR
jgi:hypothetical protein